MIISTDAEKAPDKNRTARHGKKALSQRGTGGRSLHIRASRAASRVAQWLRICSPKQETQVPSLVQEDPTRHRATKPVSPRACPLQGEATHRS